MLEFVGHLFDTTGFVPRGTNEAWPPELMWLHTGSDLFIGLACIAISLMLFYFTNRRDLPYPHLFIAFAMLLLACGVVHALEATMLRYPLYRLAGAMKFLAALTAWGVVFALMPIIPRVMEPMTASSRPFPGQGEIGDTTLHRMVAPTKWNRWNDYLVAILIGVLVLACRAAIEPLIENDYLFVLALLGVVFVSWRSGFGPGIVTLLLSLAGMVFFFLSPHYSFVVTGFGNLLATGMFFFCGVCCTGLGEAQRVARRRAKVALSVALDRKAELEVEVARRREAEFAIRQREIDLTELNRKLAVAQEQTAAAFAQVESLVLNAPVGIALLDSTLRFVQVNRAFAETTQQPISDHQGTTIRELENKFPPELVHDCERVLQSGEPALNRHLTVRSTTNSESIWQISIFPVIGIENRSIGLGLIGQNVTERERAADALRESEERFRSMADSVPVLIWVSDRIPQRTYFNKTWLEFTGRTPKQEDGNGWTESIYPGDRERYLGLYAEAFVTRKPFEVEYRLRRHDGEYRWVFARGTPRFTLAGVFTGFSGLCLDVTDRKMAEEAVLRSERNLTDFFENANVGLHWGAEDGTILRANRAELAMLGYTREEYIGKHLSAFHINPETVVSFLGRLRRGERVDNCPAQLRCKDGSVRDVLISSTVLWEDGRFIHTRTFTRDVTEHKRVEEHLRESEIRYRTLTEAIPQLVWNTTPNGHATYFNKRWIDYTGLSLGQSQGWGWIEAIHPDDRDRIRVAWQATVQKAGANSSDRFTKEFRLRHGNNGEYRWFLSVVVPLRRPTGEIDQWIGAMADIHDQKTATEAIAASERLYRAIGESIEYGVWISDGEGRCTYSSSSFLKLIGLTQEECAGFGWAKALHPDDAERTVAAWKECAAARVAGGVSNTDFGVWMDNGIQSWHVVFRLLMLPVE